MAPYLGVALLALAVVTMGLCLALVVQSRQIARLGERLASITAGEGGRSLEAVLGAHLDKVLEVSRELDGLTVRTAAAEAGVRRSFQRIGMVRFNPFEDTGSNQSFALALLDGREDGIVVSSLHSRSGTRVYAKAVVGGRAEATLSSEEAEAVEIARSQSLGRAALAERVGQSDRGAASGA